MPCSTTSLECSESMKSDPLVGEMGEKHVNMDVICKTRDKDIDLDGVPVDKGWAWILLLGKYDLH